jgi:hypothetical protein
MQPTPPRPSAAARPRPATALPSVAPYRPFGWRRRLAIAGLAVATAIAVVWLLLDPPGGVQRKRVVATASTTSATSATSAASAASTALAGSAAGAGSATTPATPAPRAAAAPETCTDGRTERCVGGKAEVIVVPPPPAER